MTFKFYSSRVKELLLIFVGGSVALLICLTIISYEGFDLHAEFVFQSAVEPIKSMLWNHNSRILTPVTIAGMVGSFFVKNTYIRVPLELVSVTVYYALGVAVVVTET